MDPTHHPTPQPRESSLRGTSIAGAFPARKPTSAASAWSDVVVPDACGRKNGPLCAQMLSCFLPHWIKKKKKSPFNSHLNFWEAYSVLESYILLHVRPPSSL